MHRSPRPGGVGAIRKIVLHLNAGPEIERGAQGLAGYLRTIDGGYHEVVDDHAYIVCAQPGELVWGASGMNEHGYHICLVGNLQSAEAWHDAYSRGEMDVAAQRVRAACHAFGIPAVQLTDLQVATDDARGVCDHWAVNRAIQHGDHVDVGPGFPWNEFMGAVRADPKPVPKKEEPMLVRANHADPNDHFVGVELDIDAGTITLVGPGASCNPSPSVMDGKAWRGAHRDYGDDPRDDVARVTVVTSPDNFEYTFRVGP